jgi:dihydroxyacetone kinase
MRLKTGLLAITLLFLANASFAQAAEPADAASCKAEEASLDQDIAQARARGQMLRRRQLSDALVALQAHCEAMMAAKDPATQIKRQEQEVQQLRLELERAEAQLRKLKAAQKS